MINFGLCLPHIISISFIGNNHTHSGESKKRNTNIKLKTNIVKRIMNINK